MEELTDDSIMPYGKDKGDKMINVPADYLLWCYDNAKCSNNVKEYIEDNLNALKIEASK